MRGSEEAAAQIRTKAAKRRVGGCAEDVCAVLMEQDLACLVGRQADPPPREVEDFDTWLALEGGSTITSLITRVERQHGEFCSTILSAHLGRWCRNGACHSGGHTGVSEKERTSHPGTHRLGSSSVVVSLVHEELLDGLQQDLLPGSRRRVRRRIGDNDSEDALIRNGESLEVPSQPTEPRTRRLVLVSSTQVDPVPPTVPDSVDGPRRRRRRVRSEGSDFELPAVVGGAIHLVLTLIDSSDNDTPFIVPSSAAARARPSRRLVLVPGSAEATWSRANRFSPLSAEIEDGPSRLLAATDTRQSEQHDLTRHDSDTESFDARFRS